MKPQDYIEIILRRKWWILLTFIIGTPIAVTYSYLLTPLYRSSTMILVEAQKIPVAYVSSTITSTVQERLSTVSQQIMSRTNLEQIIAQFGLYEQGSPELNQAGTVGYTLPMIRQKIRSWKPFILGKILPQVAARQEKESVPLEALVEQMRKDITVQVLGGGNAFTVSYIGNDPHTVMKVTDTLASLFIEENLKMRAQQAEGTSEFLESQLVEAKGRLEQQERALKDFKEKHMGALPAQMDPNLRTLDRLQLELQAINEALRSAEDRKIALDRLQLELKNIDEALRSIGDPTTPLGTRPNGSAPNLMKLKEELARLRARFNDKYPDIMILKKQISEAEGQLSEAEKKPAPDSTSSLPSGQRQSIGGEAAIRYSPELLTLNSDIESLKRKREKIISMTKEYEKRVDSTFVNEQTLANLTRDYEMSQRNYQGLLDKRLNARISENLEKKQKGEQFRIVDPANLPQKPFKPDRAKIILVGSLLSAGLGIGLILVKEYLSPSYRKPEDFQGTIDLPILGMISKDWVAQRKSRLLITMEEPDSVITEQYRALYSRMSQLINAHKGEAQTVFAITSSVKHEGKTVISLNLAFTAARDFGKKTLLIEGDLKDPMISRYLKSESQGGFIDIVLNNTEIQSGTVTFGHDNLSILPAGKRIRNSAGILSSQQMKDIISLLKERYDLILIDSPPILSLPDMSIIERLVDGIILVVRAERTPRDAPITAITSLATSRMVGIVLNDARLPSRRHYRYHYTNA